MWKISENKTTTANSLLLQEFAHLKALLNVRLWRSCAKSRSFVHRDWNFDISALICEFIKSLISFKFPCQQSFNKILIELSATVTLTFNSFWENFRSLILIIFIRVDISILCYLHDYLFIKNPIVKRTNFYQSLFQSLCWYRYALCPRHRRFVRSWNSRNRQQGACREN